MAGRARTRTPATFSCWRNSTPHLPVGLLVNDADTLEILHANPPLPGFADHDLPLDQLIESHKDEHQPHLRADELAALVEEVAATGRPRHLPRVPSRLPRAGAELVERNPPSHRHRPLGPRRRHARGRPHRPGSRPASPGGARTAARGPAADDRRRSRPQPRLLPPAGCRCPRPRPTRPT